MSVTFDKHYSLLSVFLCVHTCPSHLCLVCSYSFMMVKNCSQLYASAAMEDIWLGSGWRLMLYGAGPGHAYSWES